MIYAWCTSCVWCCEIHSSLVMALSMKSPNLRLRDCWKNKYGLINDVQKKWDDKTTKKDRNQQECLRKRRNKKCGQSAKKFINFKAFARSIIWYTFELISWTTCQTNNPLFFLSAFSQTPYTVSRQTEFGLSSDCYSYLIQTATTKK
jgi:hypothetical protein